MLNTGIQIQLFLFLTGRKEIAEISAMEMQKGNVIEMIKLS